MGRPTVGAMVLLAMVWLVGAGSGAGMEPVERGWKKATFGAGCFWGVEKIFAKVPGVVSTSVGYAGGQAKNPSYRQVCAG